MANIPLTLRLIKGSKLTFAELDNNFLSLAGGINNLPQNDSFVTGGTFNQSTNSIDFTGNYDFIPFSTDLSYLASDITVTGGTYNPSNGTVTFYNNSGGTFQVSGFLTGYTNYYTTGVTLNNTTLEFDRTDLSNAYSVDLSSLLFTGNTSGNCITDLYVSNLYGCSPIIIHDNLVIESGVTITSTNGGGQIELDYALQPSNILISTDNGGVTEAFINLQPTDLNLSSLNGDVRIQSLNSNNFRSGNLFSNRSQILMEPDFVKIGVVDPSAVFSNDYESVVVYNTLSSDQSTSNGNKWPVTVSSKNSTILSGVRNSVILGGSDITASTNNTVYVDNLNINTVGSGASVINLGLDSNGYVVTGITGSGGSLTYFIETGNTVSPNTTVPVVALIANSGSTNVDVSIVPKGTGSFMLDIPDGTATGGNKRGTNAVDLQTSRTTATQVASGQAAVIAGGDQNTASGPLSTVGGGTNNISSNFRTTVSGGIFNTASGIHASNGGGYNNVSSGEASFTVGEANTAGGSRSVALGQSNTSNGYGSATIGTSNSTAYDYNIAVGHSNTLTSGPYGNNSNVYAFGVGNTVNASNAVAIGAYGLTNGVTSRQTFSGGRITTNGDAQKSTFFYRGRTTNDTLTTLATDGNNSINAGNCMQLANNSAIRFKGTIIGKQSGSTNTVAWDVDGLIVRGSSAASTSLVVGNVNLVSNIPSWGTPVLSAYIDTFNGVGAMRIQIQGATSTNIQWTAIIDTTEVIYA